MRRSGWSTATTSGRTSLWRRSASGSVALWPAAVRRGRRSMGGSPSARMPVQRPAPRLPWARRP
eukprot:10497816-Alexandrium_andersonii.AAC.1